MLGKDDKKCVSPWLGLLAIIFVCAVIASAIFFSFKDSEKKRKSIEKYFSEDILNVNFKYSGTDIQRFSDEKIVF